MARPLGSKTIDKPDPEVLRALREAREKQLMRDLRLAAGRTRHWVRDEGGKIREKWI